MRTLLLISAITVMGMGPGVALADPDDPQGHTCIGTGCKAVYDDNNPLPPDFEYPTVPDGDICMELVADDTTPPEDQWDGCILP